MIVKYFIPEDGDEQQHPNIFNLTSSAPQPTLGDIQQGFPLPGSYHFRFLRTVAGHTVWMDVTDANANVPLYQGVISMKVSRITQSTTARPSNATGSSHPVPVTTPSAVAATTTSPPPSKPARPVKQTSDKQLLNFSEDPAESVGPAKATSASASSANNDLLGFDSTPAPTQPSAGSSVDLFGLESLQPTQGPPPMMGVAGAVPPMQSSSPITHSGINSNVRSSINAGPMAAGGRSMNPMGAGPMGATGMNAASGNRGGSNSNLYGIGQGMQYGVNPPQQHDPFNNLAGLQPGSASPSTSMNNRGRNY